MSAQMSISEENEEKKEFQPPASQAEEPIPVFILPDESEIPRFDRPEANKIRQEAAAETNFQFSAFEPKPEKIKVAAAPIESKAETVRKTGLAWSAAIVFFGSVVFMLILGWFADLLFGSSPWGIVFGIVLGSIIGFMQFFRITSRIINSSSDLQNTPLKLNENQTEPEKPPARDNNSTII
jgi:F0F1-type ATP synthase assembly protein I